MAKRLILGRTKQKPDQRRRLEGYRFQSRRKDSRAKKPPASDLQWAIEAQRRANKAEEAKGGAEKEK